VSSDDPLDKIREINPTDAAIFELARALMLANEFGGDPTSCVCEALRRLRPGNHVNELGSFQGEKIFGSLRTGVGIVDRIGVVVYVVDDEVRVLGNLI
jgi:hypothetical protein